MGNIGFFVYFTCISLIYKREEQKKNRKQNPQLSTQMRKKETTKPYSITYKEQLIPHFKHIIKP